MIAGSAFIHDMPAPEYHANPAVGSSGLRDLARSPLHFYSRHLDPNRVEPEPTPAMADGTLLHAYVLEPATFDSRYCIGPDCHHASKVWKQFIEECTARSITPITHEQLDKVMAQSASLHRNPDIAQLLSKGESELSLFWQDEATGVPCKARLDRAYPTGNGADCVILDLKTARSAAAPDFARSVVNFGYHVQAVHYTHAYRAATGWSVAAFVFGVVESEPPYAVASYVLDEEAVAVAENRRRRLLELHAECTRKGEWPGYPEGVTVLSLPRWATYDDE